MNPKNINFDYIQNVQTYLRVILERKRMKAFIDKCNKEKVIYESKSINYA